VVRSSSTQDEIIDDAPGWLNSDYVQWINTAISANITLLSELRRGDILIDLLEELSGKSIKSLPEEELDNVVAVFKFMNEEGIEINDQYTIQGKERYLVFIFLFFLLMPFFFLYRYM
jgi:hypothetical protein